ncbi:MAG TPA: hypothetical protein DFS52_06820 [Myxococcales bacterium]|nr:hypothetical protein [Myxococcales bacterium]
MGFTDTTRSYVPSALGQARLRYAAQGRSASFSSLSAARRLSSSITRGRYSEDIDLLQRTAGPIGPLVDEIRAALDPWNVAPPTPRVPQQRRPTPDGVGRRRSLDRQ